MNEIGNILFNELFERLWPYLNKHSQLKLMELNKTFYSRLLHRTQFATFLFEPQETAAFQFRLLNRSTFMQCNFNERRKDQREGLPISEILERHSFHITETRKGGRDLYRVQSKTQDFWASESFSKRVLPR